MKQLLKEDGVINTLLTQISNTENRVLTDLNQKSAKYHETIKKYQNNRSLLTPDVVNRFLQIGKELGKMQLDVFDNIGVADIPKLELVKTNMTMLKAGLSELDIMVATLGNERENAKFAENPLNAQTIEKEKNLPNQIKEAVTVLKQIDKAVQEMIEKLSGFNKEIQIMKAKLSSL